MARVDGDRGMHSSAMGGEIGDLGEVGDEHIDGWFGLDFVVVAHSGTLQLKSEPQDWPARRWDKMKRFMILPRVGGATDGFI